MGYNMYLMDYSLHIEKNNFTPALDAVKAAFPKNEEIQLFTALEDVMVEFCYVPDYNENGDICGFDFDGEKLQDDDIFWSALAPYMEDGDFIEMEGDDFNRWRWSFRNGTCHEIKPTLIWEDA